MKVRNLQIGDNKLVGKASINLLCYTKFIKSLKVYYVSRLCDQHTVQQKTLTVENFGRFVTARKLVENCLAADHTNTSSLFELTTFGR